ncbi:MAG: hypothetical protein R2699_10880 [Acidimicrobiales bacterium]
MANSSATAPSAAEAPTACELEGHPHVHRHRGRGQALHQGGEGIVAEHRALAVDLEDQGLGAGGLAGLERREHRVGDHRIEQPGHLEHVDERARRQAVRRRGLGRRRGDQRHDRAEQDGERGDHPTGVTNPTGACRSVRGG